MLFRSQVVKGSVFGSNFVIPFALTHEKSTMELSYEEKQKTLIYSVINSEAKRELLPLIRQIKGVSLVITKYWRDKPVNTGICNKNDHN